MSATQRLVQAILEVYPQRFMLSSKEISQVASLERSSAPIEQLLSWIEELIKTTEKQKRPPLPQLIRQLEQRVQRWDAQHVGDHYQREAQVSASQISEAFTQLIAAVHVATREQSDVSLISVFKWLESQLKDVAQTCATNLQYDPIDQLERLDELLFERVLQDGPHELIKRVSDRAQSLLKAESKRARPQDFIRAKHRVLWILLRAELNLPSLWLNLHGGW
jgi:hypothetical protein